MSKNYQFLKEPRFNHQAKEVTIGFEDHFNLTEYARKWLSRESSPLLAAQTNQSDLKQQIYIGIDKFYMNQQASDNTTAMLARTASISKILNSAEGQKLGKSPLDFLSKELSKFRWVTEIFASRSRLPRTDVAQDFHKACDHVENLLVIIKSGQYIAGGYTEVPFDSHSGNKPNPKLSTLVFSANRRKTYALRKQQQDKALRCDKHFGPVFGGNYCAGLVVQGDIAGDDSGAEWVSDAQSPFYRADATEGELCGSTFFQVDEYEVYKLE